MFKKTAIGLSVVVATVLMTIDTRADPGEIQNCFNYSELISRLENRYKEEKKMTGLVNSKTLMEIWISNEGEGTWTALVRKPDNQSCIIATGKFGMIEEDAKSNY